MNGRDILRRLERLDRIGSILRQNDGHDVAITTKDGTQVNGISTMERLNREAAEREAAAKRLNDYERSTFDDGHDVEPSSREDGPQCGHDVCERLYAIEQQTDPAIVAKIVAAADVDPVLSMALLLINVLEHSDDDNTDLADTMMHRIIAANPLAGLAVLERIDDIINE